MLQSSQIHLALLQMVAFTRFAFIPILSPCYFCFIWKSTSLKFFWGMRTFWALIVYSWVGKVAIRDNLVKLNPLRWSLEVVCVYCISATIEAKDKLDVGWILTLGFEGNLSLKQRRLGVGFLVISLGLVEWGNQKPLISKQTPLLSFMVNIDITLQ